MLGDMRNSLNIIVERSEKKRPFGRTRSRWKDEN
jgi:hypothetical protein